MGLATGDGGSLQGKKLKSCISKNCESSHLATSEPLASSTPLNIMLSVADALHTRRTTSKLLPSHSSSAHRSHPYDSLAVVQFLSIAPDFAACCPGLSNHGMISNYK